jgi:hypothetical protein
MGGGERGERKTKNEKQKTKNKKQKTKNSRTLSTSENFPSKHSQRHLAASLEK